MLTTTSDNPGVAYDPVTGARYAEKKPYRDNVIVTGETFNGTKFEHKLYFQNGATKEEVENALRAREVSAQRNSLKIVQGETNAEAVARQKKADEAKLHPAEVKTERPAKPAPAPSKR